MLNKKIFITSLIFFGLLCCVFSARAISVSQVNFINFTMEKASLAAGEEIKGNFILKNYEKEVVPDITYNYGLLAQDADGFYTVVIDEKFSGDNFSLKPYQTITKSFNYHLPQHLPSGRHKFRVQVLNSKGILMSSKESDVDIWSDNKFLTLNNHFLFKNGQRFLPKGEAVFAVGQFPQIIFNISNNSSFKISASPKIAFYRYDITENPFQFIEKESITLSPGETQSKTFELIDFKEPGIYFCRLTMYENNKIISNSVDFRWEVPGKKVEVMQFRIGRSSYQAGDDALVIVYLANIADLPTDEKVGLQVTIYNKDNKIVGEKTDEINLKGSEIKIKVPITENVENPKVEIAVISNNQEIVDKYQTQMEDEEISGGEVVKEEPLKEKRNVFLIIVVLAVIIAFIVYFLKKRFSAAKAVFMILLFAGVFLWINSSLAFTVVISPEGDEPTADISWELPLPPPDIVHEAGGNVQFKGNIFLSSGHNIKNNEIRFFISSPHDLILKKEGTIWVIDESPDVNPGLIYLGKSERNDPVAEVNYNKIFEIPVNVPYIGEEEARFYVQFKGQMASNNNWKWIIAYQLATIQKKGEGGLFITLKPDKTEVLFGEEITWTVKIGNNLPCIRNDTDVIPIIDVSGSMWGEKINQAKAAAITFVDKMDPAYDQLGLVSYGSTSKLEHILSLNHDSVKAAIANLSVKGCTCISCGIYTANQEMSSGRKRPNADSYHVLMTDGWVNMKMDGTHNGCLNVVWEPARIETKQQAQLSKDAGIIIYTIGFGIPPNSDAEVMMKEIADITGGQYFNAPTAQDLENIYKAIAGLITGDSPGTKIRIYIPDEFEFTSYGGAGWNCSYNKSTNELICGEWDLLCGGRTTVPPLTFTTKAVSGIAGQRIEFIATVFNSAGKQKEDTGVVLLMSEPKAEIISPDVGSWQRGNFNATFRYFQDSPSAPDLAVCEYLVESRAATGTEFTPFLPSELLEPWTNFAKTSWGSGSINPQDPYNTWYMDSRAQFIILKSELNELGFYGGKITAFHLQNAQLPGRPSLSNFRIRLKHTSKSTVTGWEGDWINCFGPTTIPKEDLTVGGWKEYACVTPFTWNGTDNLMIDISRDDTAWVGGGGMYRYLINSPDRMIAGRCDNCLLDGLALHEQTSGTLAKLIGCCNFVPAIKISITGISPWRSAGNCSGKREVFLTKKITVGKGMDCQHEGEEVCRISVRARDTSGGESKKTGDWQRVYNIDWTPPEIEIK